MSGRTDSAAQTSEPARYGGFVSGFTYGAANKPWECPRCGRMNAWWVASCRCKPPLKGPRRGI